MTTMDSDSESQDSDDGRRFRFEATRKDATTVSHNRKRVSPHSDRSERRPRSPGRSDRDRRDNERFPNRNRDSHSRRNSRQTSRDRDSKDRRDRHSQNYLKDSKDAHDSKHLKNRNGKESKSSPTQRERDDRESKDSKDARDSKDRKDSKSSRSHEKDLKNPRESGRSRDRNRKRSRDRSRSDRSSSDKHKVRSHEKCKSHSKDNHSRVKEDRVPETSEKDAKASLALGQMENNLDTAVTDSTQDGCLEFNLSDFEVVSDLEEISSDGSNPSRGHTWKVRKHQSKQQSLLLSDRDSEQKSHRMEDLRKVNPRNGNHSCASSNSNPTALSDFSLGSASPTTSANKQFKGDEEVEMEVDAETLHHSNFSQDSNKLNQRDKSCNYGPILPPKLVDSSSPRPVDDSEEMSKVIVKIQDVQNEDVEREDVKEEKLIGPLMPSSSFESRDLEIEDEFSSSAKEADLDRGNCHVEHKPEEESSNGNLQDEEAQEGCSQPRVIGPSLPIHLLPQKMEIDDAAFGPALPPHLVKKEKTVSETRIFGPMLPTESDDGESAESDDENVIGPLPADHPSAKTSIVQQSLEFRARRIQNEFMTEPVAKEKKREEWMTELPPVQAAALGLGPRKFKMRAGPDLSDRSSWTDTPVDKVRKEQEQAEERLAAIVTEKEMAKEISIAKKDASEKSKKRQKSLLEMHQKKLKKKKKKEEKEAREKGKPTRRPFDRDIDLEANRFDEAQKKHIFMKAQLLDDRFAPGKM